MGKGKSAQVETVRTALSYTALGFGAVAIVAPRAFAGIYGLKGDGNLRTMIRLWGTRSMLIGAMNFFATDAQQKRTLAAATTALSFADTLLIAMSGDDVAARTRMMGTATTASVAAASAYVLTQS
jgi:hypothetical protein